MLPHIKNFLIVIFTKTLNIGKHVDKDIQVKHMKVIHEQTTVKTLRDKLYYTIVMKFNYPVKNYTMVLKKN